VSANLFKIIDVFVPLVCATTTLFLCLFASPITQRLKLLDVPGGRKSHKRPTPLMGGVSLLFGFYPWIAIWAIAHPAPFAPLVLPIVLCAAALTILGLIDDRVHLSAAFRLGFCIAAIMITIWFTPEISVRHINWNHGGGGVTLSVVANLADGKNGLLISLALVWIYFLRAELSTELAFVLLSLSGVLAVLLAFNLAGRLFLGDGGSYGIAAFIGLMALLAAEAPTTKASSDQIALIFLLPVVDMARLMIVRAARGQSPFAGDRDHLHHHLLTTFGWPGGLTVYLMMTAMPSFLAGAAPRWTMVIIAGTIMIYFSVIFLLRKIKVIDPVARK
jgi:UDP-GlcNAc:undecaprenyl-phosphate GlcNAc-1-phosphate transferase